MMDAGNGKDDYLKGLAKARLNRNQTLRRTSMRKKNFPHTQQKYGGLNTRPDNPVGSIKKAFPSGTSKGDTGARLTPTGTNSTTGYVTRQPTRSPNFATGSRGSYKIPTRKGPLNISRAQSGSGGYDTPPKSYPTSRTPGSRDEGAFKGKRRPIPENLGKRPMGGVDYSGRGPGKRGVWTNNAGRVIATAKSEDSGSRPRGLARNFGGKRAV
jgi:hypothetical protein